MNATKQKQKPAGQKWPSVSEDALKQAIAEAKSAGSRGAASRQPVLAQGAADALKKLTNVRAALTAYYTALERREHGGVAAGIAIDAIESTLGMSWDKYRESRLTQSP